MKDGVIDLTICIVSWNSRDILRKCLNSIYQFSDGLNIETIVVDNASTDNTPQEIAAEFPDVVLLSNKINLGFGRANNLAIKKSRGRFILLLNPDVVIVRPSLRQMINFLESNPEVGCAGCKLVNLDGSIQESYFEQFPTPMNEFLEGITVKRLLGSLLTKRIYNDVIKASWIVGACMMFKRELLLKLSGFDERYFMYGEDVDLCFRLRNLGYEIVYLNNIEMLHYHGDSSKKKAKRYFSTILQRESVYRFMKAHYNNRNALLYRIFWIVSGFVRLLILIPAIIFSFLTFRKNLSFLFQVFEKYARVILWGIGFEKWTRQQIPD